MREYILRLVKQFVLYIKELKYIIHYTEIIYIAKLIGTAKIAADTNFDTENMVPTYLSLIIFLVIYSFSIALKYVEYILKV